MFSMSNIRIFAAFASGTRYAGNAAAPNHAADYTKANNKGSKIISVQRNTYASPTQSLALNETLLMQPTEKCLDLIWSPRSW